MPTRPDPAPLIAVLLALTLVGAAAAPRAQEARAQEPDAAQPQSQAAPTIELENLAGEVRERPGAGFATTDPRELGAVFVRFTGLAPLEPPAGAAQEWARLTLQNGDRVDGRLGPGEGDLLSLVLLGDTPLELSIDEIASVVFPGRLPRDGSALTVPADEGDRLYRTGGTGLDRIDGLVSSFSAEGVVFESRLGERTYPWARLAALYIEDLDESASGPDEAGGAEPVRVVAELRDGGRLSGRLLGLDARGCRLEAGGRPEVFLPARVLAEVSVDDGSYRFLSQIPVTDAGPQSPWGVSDGAGGVSDDLGMVYPHRMDRTRNGAALRAGGRRWARGIGVQAPSHLTWTLDGGWKELRCLVAVDDQVLDRGNRRGSVVFRVRVDGELRYESPVVLGGDAPRPIEPIDLRGAKELVLEVDEVEDHVMDRADWLRPILVRGAGSGNPR